MFVPHRETRHFILPALQAYTSAPLGFGKYSFPFHKLIHSVFPKPFSNTFPMVYIYFLRRVYPIKQYPQFSPPPCSCCSHFMQSCFITCACGRCIHSGSIALRELRSFLSPNPYTSLCLHLCIHLSTARHKYSFSHSIYSVPSVIPMPFSHAFPAVAFLPAASSPQKTKNQIFNIVVIVLIVPNINKNSKPK